MYLQEMRCQLFPVGQGSVAMNYQHAQYYMQQLAALGTATCHSASAEEQAIINRSKVPSHTEMVRALAPHGRPDLIILSYWLPDLDTSVGNALVTTICAMYDATANETMAISENGPAAVLSALEYAQQAIKLRGYQEVWVFSLNQFQGASMQDGELFWQEPGRGVWLRLLAQPPANIPTPRLQVRRQLAAHALPSSINLSQRWRTLCAELETLGNLRPPQAWQYVHQHEYNRLQWVVSAEF